MAQNIGTAATNSALQGVIDTAITVGQAAVHALAPNEIEYYLCSLELLDTKLSRQAFLAFSVMPTDILDSHTAIATITKTQYAVIENFASGFQPRDISIRGTFGKKFRLVQAVNPATPSPTNYFDNAGFVNAVTNLSLDFPIAGENVTTPTYHSGYGLSKLLERMVEMSNQEVDVTGRPYIMIFTNHARNYSYVVEVMQSSFSQSEEANFLHYYSLEMKAVAPASALLRENTKTGFILQAGINAAANAVSGIVKDTVNAAIRGL